MFAGEERDLKGRWASVRGWVLAFLFFAVFFSFGLGFFLFVRAGSGIGGRGKFFRFFF